MADAQDLKSWDRKKSCRFESDHRHQPRKLSGLPRQSGTKAGCHTSAKSNHASSCASAGQPLPIMAPARRRAEVSAAIVGSGYEICPGLRPLHPAIAVRPNHPRFHPTKDFFHPFTQALADAITGTPGGASIQSRNFLSRFAGRVRRDLPLAAPGHKFLLVIRFVRTQGGNSGGVQLPMFVHLRQRHRRFVLGNGIMHRDGCAQSVAVAA